MKTFTLLLCALIFSFSSLHATILYWKPTSGTSAKNKSNWRTSNCGNPPTSPPSSFTSNDTLIFNGSCSTSSCTFDTTFNAKAISVTSNYTGTISTSTGITLTFATGVFTGGTFTGGSIAITFTESFRINGGIFTSTSGVLTLIGDVAFTSGT